MQEAVQFSQEGPVALVHLDDGKANALGSGRIQALEEALDRAEKEAGALLILGRPGCFSAGFDLKELSKSPESAARLVSRGALLLARILESPLPVVAGCSGHAVAMGALLLMAADSRIGAAGAFKLGLNEVAIRMVLPEFAVRLSRERLSRRHLVRSALLAELYDPETARDAGYLDRVEAPEALEQVVRAEALRLAELPRDAFAGTKALLRGPLARAVRESAAELDFVMDDGSAAG